MTTVLTFYLGWNDPYWQNLITRLTTSTPFSVPWQTLENFYMYTIPNVPGGWFVIKMFIATWILATIFFTKPRIHTVVFYLSSFFLLSYSLVYDYHYTVLIPCLVIGLLTEKAYSQKGILLSTAILTLPSPYFILSHWEIFTQPLFGHIVASSLGAIILGLWKILPLLWVNGQLMFCAWRERASESAMKEGSGSEEAPIDTADLAA